MLAKQLVGVSCQLILVVGAVVATFGGIGYGMHQLPPSDACEAPLYHTKGVDKLNALSHHNVSHPDDRVVNFWIDATVRRLLDSSAPNLVRDLDHEVQLRPLFVYGENVAFLRAGEAALRTQAE